MLGRLFGKNKDTSGEAVVKAVISRKTDKISEIKLRISYDNGENKR